MVNYTLKLLKVILLIAVMPVLGQQKEHQHERNCGALYGVVLDEDSNEPVAGTQILLLEINRSGVTHADGHFYLPGLPLGSYTLQTFRIGYQTLFSKVNLAICDTNRVTLKLSNSPLQMQALVVTDQTENGYFKQTAETPIHMEGKKLRQELGRTIANTLADEPGLDQRSMGPAPARPIMRGLGGDRLLILEDGERVGDLSATSADHAVVVEPMTADRIEVIRGPGALMYGPNTLGGVINVARGYVPTTFLDHVHGTFTYQGETVNSGNSGGLSLTAPLGPLSMRVDGSGRKGHDIDTPNGTLLNTGIETYNGSAGMSLVRQWGYIGVAGAYYQSDYGIPGGFLGAHPNGVDIELERKHLEAKSAFYLNTSLIKQLELHGTYSRYFHQEFESSGILGIEFGLLTYNASAVARLQNRGVFQNGVFGLWGEYRDYASGGFSFTPATKERTLAGYYYQEAIIGDLDIKGAIRFDTRTVTPDHEKVSNRIGLIHERTFGDYSGSLSAHYHILPQLYAGASAMRSFRAPGIEELFSEGPHLASYSFEVGNPKLPKEIGLGLEAYLHYRGQRGGVELSLFRNDIANYIFPQNTGQLNYRTLLPTYQFVGLDVLMTGGEISMEYEVLDGLALSGSMSYVRGELTDLNTPLPWMPPLNGKLDVKFSREKYSLGTRLRTASEQDRLGEFEERTSGYVVFDFFAQYIFNLGHFLSTIDLSVSNLTDAEYRKHLSRVKSVMPEPGRNIRMLYRLYF